MSCLSCAPVDLTRLGVPSIAGLPSSGHCQRDQVAVGRPVPAGDLGARGGQRGGRGRRGAAPV